MIDLSRRLRVGRQIANDDRRRSEQPAAVVQAEIKHLVRVEPMTARTGFCDHDLVRVRRRGSADKSSQLVDKHVPARFMAEQQMVFALEWNKP